MAKMNEEKAAMFMVTIVGVVAIVGITILLMNAGIGFDTTGQATSAIKTNQAAAKLDSGIKSNIGSSSTTASASSSCSNPNQPYCSCMNACVSPSTCANTCK